MRGHFVEALELGPWQNFSYLIGCRATREVAVVDPAWDATRILAEVDRLGLTLRHIFCTHSHFDHINRLDHLLAACDAQVHLLAAEVDWSGFRCENLVRHAPGDRVRVGQDLEVGLMHTPGHTPGSMTLRLPDSVVTGDTLFVNGCGRCDFVGGDPVVMYQTLQAMIHGLPPETVMYPGHNYGATTTSTLDEQLRNNPYLLQPTLDDFVKHRMTGKTPGTALPPAPAWDRV